MTRPRGPNEDPPPYRDPYRAPYAEAYSDVPNEYGQPPMAYNPPPPPPQPFSDDSAPTKSRSYSQPKTRNGWAIAALIAGILPTVVIGLVLGVVGLIKSRSTRSGRAMSIVAIVLSVVWAVVILLFFGVLVDAVRGDAAKLQAGDCVKKVPDSTQVQALQRVTCDKPHMAEVYAAFTMPDGPFPGQDAIKEYQNKCEPALAEFSPAAEREKGIGILALFPTEKTWADGDRTVACIATTPGARTATLKGIQ